MSETETLIPTLTVKWRKQKLRQNLTIFQREWLRKMPWLMAPDDDSAGRRCRVCLYHKKSNTFTGKEGCTNFRTSTLERHEKNQGYIQALQEKPLQTDFTLLTLAFKLV
jgi:hypothetical protein